jgi:hypothetical protein
MNLNLLPRRRQHESAHDREQMREDGREKRLDRQQADLVDREAALNERERRVRARERAQEQEESQPVVPADAEQSTRRPGGEPPGRMSKEAALIVRADAIRRGAVTAADVPLPIDKTARMIAQFARDLGQPTTARPEPGRLSPAAKLIINAHKIALGGDIDEAL